MQTHMYDCHKQRDDLFRVMLTEGEALPYKGCTES